MRISLWRIASSHCCPACGQGDLFQSLLKIAPQCSFCGQSFGEEDTGDGPAFFVIVVAGFAITIAASMAEYFFAPPLWLHAALWIPLTFASALYLLRVMKAVLIALQYRTQRLKKDEHHKD